MAATALAQHPAGSTVQRVRKPGVDITIVTRGAFREFHFTFRPLPNDRPGMLMWRLEAQLREYGATVVKHDVFGHITAYADSVARLRRLMPGSDWPITWIDDGSCARTPVPGMQVLAVSGVPVETVRIHDVPVARVFDDGCARHCFAAVFPQELNPKPPVQAREAFEQLHSALRASGMHVTDVIRTWLFLDEITSWYGDFNAVRTRFFREHGVFDALVPASTGIGARNPHGAALIASAWALQPREDGVEVQEVLSPLQCPAPQYGSSFSRAVEVRTPGHRRVLVSGTASINPDGDTAHPGAIDKQINLTMDVVEAILRSRYMSFRDAHRATVYFNDLKHAPQFAAWCDRNSIAGLPLVAIQADVCRDDLLFEIELDAVTATRRSQ